MGTVAGAVLTAPLIARAQSQNGRIVRIGYLDGSSPSARTSLIVGHMRQHRLPAMCSIREYAQSGCLISYGPSYADHFRRAASVIDKILKGAKPGDLPVQPPTKFELVINLQTARALGLTIPPSLLTRADQVIE